ncbi:MAG: hypothetical protein J6X45_03960 [Lachnospiraceae bacterium]|nr:hypothetical protein [Lachnospiraceae bacterium]
MADVNNTEYRFVDFEKFCKDCKYYNEDEHGDHCDECLSNPVNIDSFRPTMFKPLDPNYNKKAKEEERKNK